MCGRLYADYEVAQVRAGLPFAVRSGLPANFQWRAFNVAPTQRVVMLTSEHELTQKRWGITFRDLLIINSRLEEFFRKKLFTNMERCVVPVSGYFEWSAQKRPFCFTTDRPVMLLAGLFDQEGVVLMTREASGALAEVHHRMPVILEGKEDVEAWLSPKLELGFFQKMLDGREYPEVRFYQVAPYVNDVRHTDQKCLLSADEYKSKVGIKKFFGGAEPQERSLPLGQPDPLDRLEAKGGKMPAKAFTPMKKPAEDPEELEAAERRVLAESEQKVHLSPIAPTASDNPHKTLPKHADVETLLADSAKLFDRLEKEKFVKEPKPERKRPGKIKEEKALSCDLRWFYETREKPVAEGEGVKPIIEEPKKSANQELKRKAEVKEGGQKLVKIKK